MASFFKKFNYSIVLLIISDIFFIFILWAQNSEKLLSLSFLITVFTLFTIVLCFFIYYIREKHINNLIQNFINNPDEENKELLSSCLDKNKQELLESLYNGIKYDKDKIENTETDILNYKEYIDSWVHEIKTPLSLLTLILNNHKDEMSGYIFTRLNHIGEQISDNTERILYYSRLKTKHPDYNFSKVDLSDILCDSISNFSGIVNEKRINIIKDIDNKVCCETISDKKVLAFIISQIISNATKYCLNANPAIKISINKNKSSDNKEKFILKIEDNGIGVKPEDLPFIFEKGFCGDNDTVKKSTGMGLYIVKNYCKALNIQISAQSIYKKRFAVTLEFPTVSEEFLDKKLMFRNKVFN